MASGKVPNLGADAHKAMMEIHLDPDVLNAVAKAPRVMHLGNTGFAVSTPPPRKTA